MKKIVILSLFALILASTVSAQKSANTSANAITITDASFNKLVLSSDKLVIVDFWAEWCAPCRKMGPVIEELAKEYKGKVVIGKVDVDKNGATAQKYNITGIPAILFFKKGKLVDNQVGMTSKDVLKKKIEKNK